MRIRTRITLLLLIISCALSAQHPIIYDITYGQRINGEEMQPLVSLSGIYNHSEHPDSSAIPDVESMGIDSAGRIVLKGEYRKRFFQNTGLKESDNLYAYDYKNSKLVTLPLKTLPIVAMLSIYTDDSYWPFKQDDYQIGFELNKQLLTDAGEYYRHTLISIGKTNPFITGKMHPIKWQTIADNEFVFKPLTQDDSAAFQYYNEGVTTQTYTYRLEGLQYFTKEFKAEEEPVARQLAVVDIKNNARLFEFFYYTSEGSSPTPLNPTAPQNNEAHQWTGQLLNGKPPVILGLLYVSVGCPLIHFITPANDAISINCDNRH